MSKNFGSLFLGFIIGAAFTYTVGNEYMWDRYLKVSEEDFKQYRAGQENFDFHIVHALNSVLIHLDSGETCKASQLAAVALKGQLEIVRINEGGLEPDSYLNKAEALAQKYMPAEESYSCN